MLVYYAGCWQGFGRCEFCLLGDESFLLFNTSCNYEIYEVVLYGVEAEEVIVRSGDEENIGFLGN